MKLLIELPALLALGQTEPVSVIQFVNSATPQQVYTGTGLLRAVAGNPSSVASLLVNADVATNADIAVTKLAAGLSRGILTSVGGINAFSLPEIGVVTFTSGATTDGNLFGTWAEVRTAVLAMLADKIGRVTILIGGDGTVDATLDCQGLVSLARPSFTLNQAPLLTFTGGAQLLNPLACENVTITGTFTVAEPIKLTISGGSFTMLKSAGMKPLTGSTKSVVLIDSTAIYQLIDFGECAIDQSAAPTIPLIKIDNSVQYVIGRFLYGKFSFYTHPTKLFGSPSAGSSCYLDLYHDSSSVRPQAQSSFTGTTVINQIDLNLCTGTGLVHIVGGQIVVAAGLVVTSDCSSATFAPPYTAALIGASTPYGAHGRGTKAMSDANYTVAAAEYSVDAMKYTGTLSAGRTLTYPTATDAQGYSKEIHNATTQTLTISVGSGTTKTLASGLAQRFSFHSAGVEYKGGTYTP